MTSLEKAQARFPLEFVGDQEFGRLAKDLQNNVLVREDLEDDLEGGPLILDGLPTPPPALFRWPVPDWR